MPHTEDSPTDLVLFLLKLERRTTDAFLRAETLRVLLEERGVISRDDFARTLGNLSRTWAHGTVQDESLEHLSRLLQARLDTEKPSTS